MFGGIFGIFNNASLFERFFWYGFAAIDGVRHEINFLFVKSMFAKLIRDEANGSDFAEWLVANDDFRRSLTNL